MHGSVATCFMLLDLFFSDSSVQCERALESVQEYHLGSLASNQWHISIVNTVETELFDFLQRKWKSVNVIIRLFNFCSYSILTRHESWREVLYKYTHSIPDLFLSLTKTNIEFLQQLFKQLGRTWYIPAGIS